MSFVDMSVCLWVKTWSRIALSSCKPQSHELGKSCLFSQIILGSSLDQTTNCLTYCRSCHWVLKWNNAVGDKVAKIKSLKVITTDCQYMILSILLHLLIKNQGNAFQTKKWNELLSLMCGMNKDCFWTQRKSFSIYVYGSRCYTVRCVLVQGQHYAATIERASWLIARGNLYLKNEKLWTHKSCTYSISVKFL